MEMLNEPPLVMGVPFLIQVYVSGGPFSVSPARVKDGEVSMNEDVVILTTGLVITPSRTVEQIISENACGLYTKTKINKHRANNYA